MSYNCPEPNLNPPEPVEYTKCICCGGEIYKGESCFQYIWHPDVCICSECYYSFHSIVAGEED